MDIEQLKMVLDAVSRMGEGAKEFGIYYLATNAAVSLVPNILLFIAAITAIRVAGRILIPLATVNSAVWQIAAKLDYSTMSPWMRSDTQRVIEKIDELQRG